jgi:hypothetical protein
MDLNIDVYEQIETIIHKQNCELLKMICKKYHWNYSETYRELFSK